MKQFLFLVVASVTISSCAVKQSISVNKELAVLDEWHAAAAQADFNNYFNLMTSDAVFIGTDATENWQVADFKAFSKPYFDKGKAWAFTSLERNGYQASEVIYFDELLDTQMGICRGSGVLKKENGSFKIAHYVLSIAVPNENVSSLTEMKKMWDDNYIKKLNTK